MTTIPQTQALAALPVAELNEALRVFLEPVTSLLPEARLSAVTELLVQGVVTSQSPVITQMARGVRHAEETIWPTCQRGYRFLSNGRFSHWTLQKGLYRVAQATVVTQPPAYLVIAVDPVNFEKPYTEHGEGVSTVIKSRPPSLNGAKRKTRGYPAITATVVNLTQPAVSYAQWFSYRSADFISQNREVERAVRMSRAVFPREKLRFVGDAGLDDQKVFAQVARVQAEFVIRVCHDRNVEVWNRRLHRWEPEALFDLTASVPFEFEQEVCFTHARRVRRARLRFGWLTVRLPEREQRLWVLVVHDPADEHDLILLTNVPLTGPQTVRQVYADWRQRGQIEHGYRFEQEDGLDVEDLRVQTLERMRRLFILVLLAAQFVCAVAHTWSPDAIRWLRQLGGQLGLTQDRDGLYVLLRGISAVWQTAATLSFLADHPFPRRF